MSARFDHRVGRTLLALAIVLAFAVVPRLAVAEEADIVLLGTADALSRQIHAELTAAGFRVVWMEAAQAFPTFRDAEDASAEADAIGAVYAEPTLRNVEVWLVDMVGITWAHEVLHTEPSAIESDRVVAVRLVEFLRARLLEEELPDPAPDAVQPDERQPARAIVSKAATPDVGAKDSSPKEDAPDSSPSQSSSPFLFEGGFGESSGFRATGLTPFFTLGAFWQAVPRFAFGLSVRGPLAREQVRRPVGTLKIVTSELLARSRFYPIAGSGPVQPYVGGGVGVFWFHVAIDRDGLPATEQLFVVGPHADVGIDWRLSPRFSLRSSLGADYPLSTPGVVMSSRRVALRRPLVMGALAVEFRTDSIANDRVP